MRCRLRADKDVQVLAAGRAVLDDAAALREFVAGSQAVVHLAGMNRGADAEIEAVNLDLADRLIAACEGSGATPHVVYANSAHHDRSTAYARSKRRVGERLAAWAAHHGARYTDFILPNVFGEGGRPFYNSVVATFCHQLAVGKTPRVIDDREIELVHAQEVATHVVDAVQRGVTGEVRLAGRPIRVGALLRRLEELLAQYRQHVLPSFADVFDLSLFNTLRHYLFPRHYPVRLEIRRDPRGSLFEAVRTMHGGQCFFSSTRPGITRGNHYHRAKVERFLVVQGAARIRIRRLLTTEVTEFDVSGETPAYIDIPTLHTHDITNTGQSDLITLFWAHEFYDPRCPDTYTEPV